MNELNYINAYLIRFKRIENIGFLKTKIFPQFNSILSEDDFKHLAIEEDEHGRDVMVLFVEQKKAQAFIQICNIKELIIARPRDITEALLYNNIKEKVVLKMMASEEFKPVFDTFFRKHLTVDIILEKISKSGIDSLSDIEKEILNEQ